MKKTYDSVTGWLRVCKLLSLIIRSSPERWPNKPGKNVRTWVRPYVHNETECSQKPNSGIC